MYQILIADDEVEIRNGIARYFPWNELGFNIAALCSDGEEALERINAMHIDIVLTDIVMQKMGGLELAQYIHQNKLPILVYVLSGFPEFSYAQQAIKFGVKQFIVKPTKYQELYAVFSSLKSELDASRLPVESLKELDKDRSYYAGLIRAIKQFLQENLDQATLERAAQHVHMNSAYLSSIFRLTTGICFSDYLQKLRMQKATEMLRNPTSTIVDISQAVGYTSSNNFTRAFKGVYGLTPSEYRFRLRHNHED